jgi:hypothetical protein
VYTWANVTYPLLVIRLMPAVFHLRPLPADLSRDVLAGLGQAAMDALKRKHQMCLVFSPHEALYYLLDGRALESRQPPEGGFNPGFYPPELDFLPALGEAEGET